MANPYPPSRGKATKRGGSFYGLIGAAVIVVAGGVAAAIYFMTPDAKAPALAVAGQFLDAIDNQDYKTAYETFDANNRYEMTAEQFAQKATDMLGRNGIAKSRRLVMSELVRGTTQGTIVSLIYEIRYESHTTRVACVVHTTAEGWKLMQAGLAPGGDAPSTRP